MAQEINCPFEEYSTESATVKKFLNDDDTITDKFKNKVKIFLNEKFDHLITNMQRDIFYDHTVYTGSAGIALLYYKLTMHNSQLNHGTLLKSLDYMNFSKLKGKRISFLCGDAGTLAVAAAVSYHLGEKRPETLKSYKYFCNRLLELESLLNESPDELLYGKSGYLYSLLFVNKQIGKEVIPADHIKKVITAIFRSGQKFSAKTQCESPLLWQWHDKIYLGGAHGVAGILYLLLQARQYICSTDMRDLVLPTLSWLLNLQFARGNFPSSLGSSSGDRLVQWCHGAPGFVPLCLLAYQIFDKENYLEIALRCGEVVWQRMCTKGYSLCHGVGGNAYTFIQLYQVTKDSKHLYRACCFLEWCMLESPGSQKHPPDRPASLFEGLAGRIFLADDMLHIDQAAFPAYTV